jgi:hypothetical protein
MTRRFVARHETPAPALSCLLPRQSWIAGYTRAAGRKLLFSSLLACRTAPKRSLARISEPCVPTWVEVKSSETLQLPRSRSIHALCAWSCPAPDVVDSRSNHQFFLSRGTLGQEFANTASRLWDLGLCSRRRPLRSAVADNPRSCRGCVHRSSLGRRDCSYPGRGI